VTAPAASTPAPRSLRGRLGPPERLGPLADDDGQHARLRDALRVFLQGNGSYKATAERLILHKDSVQYRSARPRRPSAIPSATTSALLLVDALVGVMILRGRWRQALTLEHT
jgi:sugar diacid utilization regulator